MSKVVFLCRFQKSPNDPVFQEIEDQLNTRYYTENDFDREKERTILMAQSQVYDYAPLLFDLKDMCASNQVDDVHTSIRLYNNFNYTLKVPYDRFLEIYQTFLGVALNDFTATDFLALPDDQSTNQ